MQFLTLAVLSALAALTSAQSLSDLPACAQTCVGTSLGTTGCQGLDIACICNSKGWIAGLACCISNSCSPADQATTIKFADQLCATAGVTDLPSAAGCASGVSSSTASGSASSMASSMASTSMSGSVLSSAVAGTVSMSSTAGMSSMASSGSMSTTQTNAVVPASTATVQATSASPASSAGAGHLVGQGMGAVGGLVAALAML